MSDNDINITSRALTREQLLHAVREIVAVDVLTQCDDDIDAIMARNDWADLLAQANGAVINAHGKVVPPVWGQNTWGEWRPECGTTACVAGWTAILHQRGNELVDAVGRTGKQQWEALPADQKKYRDPGVSTPCVRPVGTGRALMLDSYAAEALGLDSDQAAFLFYVDRTQTEVLGCIDALIEDPQVELDVLCGYRDPEDAVDDEDDGQCNCNGCTAEREADEEIGA